MTFEIIIGREDKDKKEIGNKATIYLGKHYVKMGNVVSLSNRVLMDVSKPHVVLVAGKRGSGKSHSLGIIAEEMSNLPEEVSHNLSIIIFDTMGIFWTSKFENTQDDELLKKWNLKPNKLNVKIFTPEGFFKEYKTNGIPVDVPFTLTTGDLEVTDWCNIFEVSMISELGILIDKVISKLKKEDYNFSLDDIISKIRLEKNFSKDIVNATESRFNAAKSWGIFSEKGIKLDDLVQPGKVAIVDLSCYTNLSSNWNIKGLVIGLISRKLLIERINKRKIEEVNNIESGQLYVKPKENELPLIWLLIDEAAEYLPKKGKSTASDSLIQILREGRQPGISLVLATQQPGEIHTDVLTQSDVVISHRVTAKRDIEALNSMMQSYLYADILKYLNQLPNLKGSAIVLDDNSERIYPIQVRPRFSWHGGSSPSALKKEKTLFSI
ncbi:ATP-binding protein [Candidatus Woesearchaeota archaeon]|nr:ATP-binding protein [Candidatus Woesearchaeota archaeon]